jgi:ribosomal protein S18 acetylase RimI-like enzyme
VVSIRCDACGERFDVLRGPVTQLTTPGPDERSATHYVATDGWLLHSCDIDETGAEPPGLPMNGHKGSGAAVAVHDSSDRPSEPVSIRYATADDVARIAQIVGGEPGDDVVSLMGSVELARRYRAEMVALEQIPNPARPTVVAQQRGRVVGTLQYRLGNSGRHGQLARLRLLLKFLGPLGVLRRARKLLATRRVYIPIPEDSLYITNVHVETASQGHGIGAGLLDWAEQEAIRVGARLMTLTAAANNPAIRLYERHGFTITLTATDADYARLLDVPGRVLMEKTLES